MHRDDRMKSVLDRLGKHLDVGLAFVDADRKCSWMDENARRLLRLDGEMELDGAIAEELRAVSSANGAEPRTRAIVVAEGDARIVLSAIGETTKEGGTLVRVESEDAVAATAQSVRSSAAALDVARLARRFGHDVRTPLNAMNLQLALLERAPADALDGDPEFGRSKLISSLREEIRRIDRLASEFVGTLSVPDPEPQSADLAETVRRVVADLQAVFRLAAVECNLCEPANPIRWLLRHDLVRHGLVNLLLHAVDRGVSGQIEIEILEKQESVRVRIPRVADLDSIREEPRAMARSAIRKAVAIEDLEAAGATVLATERERSAWFEIEFQRATPSE